MVQAYFECGGGKDKAPHLTIKGLSKYLTAEFECFLIYVTYLAEQMLEFTEGNPFAQFIHDAATLANHHKHTTTTRSHNHPEEEKEISALLADHGREAQKRPETYRKRR